jgi:hypothetical protein
MSRVAPLVLLLLAAAAHARHGETLAEGEQQGTIIAVDAAGHWKPIPDVTVRLACVATERPSDANHWRRACDASLRLERNGKVIAKRNTELLGIDFEQVAGNRGELELDLVAVDGEASLVVLRALQREGDMWSRESTNEQWLAIDGATLREVHRYEALRAYDPGPDGKPEERELVKSVISAASARTRGVPNLVVTTQSGDDAPDVSTLAWDGKRYADCTSCAAPATATTTAPASLVDASTGRTIEPLLAKVLAGQRLSADDVKPLSADSLSRLRNAPYARHGRVFKNPALQAFFYAPRPGELATRLLPLQPNAAFAEALLDGNDKANVAVVTAEQRRRGK